MQWEKGFSARYYAEIVDPKTWHGLRRFEIISASIDRQSKETLMESADITVKRLESNGENWVRIWLDARQGRGGSQHIPLFTGLTAAPERKINGKRNEFGTECYSVLKPASEVLLDRGWYADTYTAGAKIVKNLLSATPAPIFIEKSSSKLSKPIISENGETNLSMARKILEAMDWRIHISGHGEITLRERSDRIKAIYGIERDMIELSITDKKDWYSCPNVFRAVSGSSIAIARDDDINSPLSVTARQREIWKEDTDCKLSDEELLAAYAQRRLKEEQSISRTLKYKKRYDPSAVVEDVIRIVYPGQNIVGNFRIYNQKITLGHGCKVEEEVTQIE